jgi:serine/threonine protein kinase
MQQIGRYRILGELGRGAMGVVYKAEDPSIGRIVAIKTIRLADAPNDKERQFLRERLFREARSAGILSHPGIVTIYDIYEQDGICYVFMEFVDGPTLEKILQSEEALNKKLLLHVLEQTATALDFAHGKGIVHRDIKPANIMLTSAGDVKITDFGVAKFTSQQATNTGVLLGTPSYMSPEQIADRAVDGRSDQFALAVIAYQLLTGERPFVADSLPALMFKIVNEEQSGIGRINPTLGPGVDIVLKKALTKDAGARYPTCSQFIRALTGACESRYDWQPMRQGAIDSMETVAEPKAAVVIDEPAPAVELVEPPAPKAKRTWVWFAAGFALTMLLVLAIRYLLFSNDLKEASSSVAQQRPAADDSNRPSALGPAATVPTPAPTPAPTETSTATEEPKAGEPEPPPLRAPANGRSVPEPAGESRVRVVTSPPGARVIVDGQPRLICTSPCNLDLSPGRHTLATMLNGYRNQPRIFQVPQDREIIIALDKAFGTLMVASAPPGATITINGRERNEKTPAMLTLATGRHKIELSKDGRREEQDIEIKDGVVTKIDVSWTR